MGSAPPVLQYNINIFDPPDSVERISSSPAVGTNLGLAIVAKEWGERKELASAVWVVLLTYCIV